MCTRSGPAFLGKCCCVGGKPPQPGVEHAGYEGFDIAVSQHSWCRYETLSHSGSDSIPCNSVAQLATNFDFPSAVCECACVAKHVDSKRLGKSKSVRRSAVLNNFVDRAIQELSSVRQRRQPELKSLSQSESHFLKSSSSILPRPNLRVQVSHVPAPQFVAPAFPASTMSLDDAESFAKTCRLNGDSSWDTCWKVVRACNAPYAKSWFAGNCQTRKSRCCLSCLWGLCAWGVCWDHTWYRPTFRTGSLPKWLFAPQGC